MGGYGLAPPAPLHPMGNELVTKFTQGGFARAPQLEETLETPPSLRAEGLLFLHSVESNPGSSLQTEEEAGLL